MSALTSLFRRRSAHASADAVEAAPRPILADKGPNKPVWIIEPRGPGLASQFREIWRYRYLFRFFGKRAIEKRTRRTILGYWWLLIRPLFPIVISTFVFGSVLRVQSADVPYFLFMLSGMSIWLVFRSSLMWCTRSVEINRGIIQQLHFPRIIVPLATSAPALIDLLIYFVVLAVAIAYYAFSGRGVYVPEGWGLLIAIGAALVGFVYSLAIGLFTAIAGAQTRDLRFSLGYITNFWMLLTPVVYPVSYMPDEWRWLLYLNPMAPVIETFKWGLLGIGEADYLGMAVGATLIAVSAIFGFWYFQRYEAASSDRV